MNSIELSQIIASALVMAGVIILVIALLRVKEIRQKFDAEYNPGTWGILQTLMYLFLLGFGASLAIILLGNTLWLKLLLGVVFMMGAVFVLLVMKTSLDTLKNLKKNEMRFRHLISEVQDYAIIMMDKEGYIQTWNQGAQKIKGYAKSEIIGQNFRRFYTEQDRASNQPDKLLEMALLEGRAQDEGWRVKKDGSTFWANVSITAIHDEKGEITGFSKVTRDLTERKKAEDITREHLQELQLKNNELEQFTYIASHDLQEPLNTLQSLIDILKVDYSNMFDEAGEQTLDYIMETTDRMSQLVKGLLDYGRIGRNKELSKVDCTRLVLDIQRDLATAFKEKDASLYMGPLPTISAYETDIRLLFQNLISNAIKFKRPGINPAVKVTAERHDDRWHFSVKDNGIGISDEHKERIFVIFQRINNRDAYEGTGIGLAHCKKIIELHGGEIWVESASGEGSAFHFTIPIKNNHEKEIELHIAS